MDVVFISLLMFCQLDIGSPQWLNIKLHHIIIRIIFCFSYYVNNFLFMLAFFFFLNCRLSSVWRGYSFIIISVQWSILLYSVVHFFFSPEHEKNWFLMTLLYKVNESFGDVGFGKQDCDGCKIVHCSSELVLFPRHRVMTAKAERFLYLMWTCYRSSLREVPDYNQRCSCSLPLISSSVPTTPVKRALDAFKTIILTACIKPRMLKMFSLFL